MYANLDEQLDAFRTRPLDHIRFPCLFLDATHVKARVDHRNVSQAIVIATGVTRDGGREVVGVMAGDSRPAMAKRVEPHWSGEVSSGSPGRQRSRDTARGGTATRRSLPRPWDVTVCDDADGESEVLRAGVVVYVPEDAQESEAVKQATMRSTTWRTMPGPRG